MASIIERRNRRGGVIGWQAQVRRRGYPVQTRTFRNYRDAELWAATIESEMGRGVFVPRVEGERTTLAEALERYQREVAEKKRGSVQERSIIQKLLAEPITRASLAHVRSSDIASLAESWSRAGLAPATVNRRLAVLSHLYETAARSWGIEGIGNPVKRAPRLKVRNARDRRLLPGEESRLLAACRAYGGPIESLVILALETAMRRGELASMRWEHLDGKVLLVPETKTGEPRRVPLSTRAREVLASLPRRLDGWVWGIRADSITQAFDRAVRRARADYEAACSGATECRERGEKPGAPVQPDPRMLRDLRFHDLRHEATSRLFEKGLNPMEVAAVTGHKTLQMLKRYTHLRAEDLVERLG